MVLVDTYVLDLTLVPAAGPVVAPAAPGEQAVRRALLRQIGHLERQLADALVAAFPFRAIDVRVPATDGPRLLGLADLEVLRDDLAEKLQDARAEVAALADRQAASRALLEDMLREPRRHRFTRLDRCDLGEGGCGAYRVRPRLGLLGMLMGWWHVKLSSGCPLAGA